MRKQHFWITYILVISMAVMTGCASLKAMVGDSPLNQETAALIKQTLPTLQNPAKAYLADAADFMTTMLVADACMSPMSLASDFAQFVAPWAYFRYVPPAADLQVHAAGCLDVAFLKGVAAPQNGVLTFTVIFSAPDEHAVVYRSYVLVREGPSYWRVWYEGLRPQPYVHESLLQRLLHMR